MSYTNDGKAFCLLEKAAMSLTDSKTAISNLKMVAQLEMLPQIILATIDFENFRDEIKTPTTVITLTEQRKLLCDRDYINNTDTAMAELLRNS